MKKYDFDQDNIDEQAARITAWHQATGEDPQAVLADVQRSCEKNGVDPDRASAFCKRIYTRVVALQLAQP